MWPPGEPRFDLWGFVGGIVIHDDMDIEPFGDLPLGREFAQSAVYNVANFDSR